MRKKERVFLLFIITTLLLVPVSQAHANILFDIDLDFDVEAKEQIISAAQEFLETTDNPSSFDYDQELIIVKFRDSPLLSVAINAFDYQVFGMEDYDKQADDGDITTSTEERKARAEEIFSNIPTVYQEEMEYGEERADDSFYTYTWYRYKEGIVVPKERLEVTIDGRNGEIISWKLNIFSLPSDKLETSPAITADVAEKIPEILYEATSLDAEPVLIIHEGDPVWVLYMQVWYPIYIGISAVDGKVVFTGSMKGTLPDAYAVGKDVTVMQSTLIQEIYGGA